MDQMRLSARKMGAYIANTAFAALGGHSIQDIETWDDAHNSFDDLDPVQLLVSLMEEKGMKAKDLADELEVSKGLISDILNYKKGMSKEIIRGLSNLFAVSHEAFNRHYDLETAARKKELVYA